MHPHTHADQFGNKLVTKRKLEDVPRWTRLEQRAQGEAAERPLGRQP